MNIYVYNLPFFATEDNLREAFQQFGDVGLVQLEIDSFTGRSMGCAYVEMPDNEQGEAAIKAMNGQILLERSIGVREALSDQGDSHLRHGHLERKKRK